MVSMIDFWSAGRGFFPGHANNILYYFHKSITKMHVSYNEWSLAAALKGPVEL